MSASEVTDPARESPRPGSRVRLAIAFLVIGGATLIVRAAPLFDASVVELWGRLSAIHQEMTAARTRPAEWEQFASRAGVELKRIAEEARRAHDRRLGPWRWIAGSDRREEAALKEAQRIAESDLPALIASGTAGSAVREKNTREALARLDDHLAGASPYLPPLRPVENQEGLDRDREKERSLPRWVVNLIVVDVALLVLGVTWWSKRSRRRKLAAARSG